MTLTKEVVGFANVLHIQDEHFKLPSVSPEEMMRWLMEKNNHKQTDMIDVASRTVINEVLNGKRKLNRLHIERLCLQSQLVKAGEREYFFDNNGNMTAFPSTCFLSSSRKNLTAIIFL